MSGICWFPDLGARVESVKGFVAHYRRKRRDGDRPSVQDALDEAADAILRDFGLCIRGGKAAWAGRDNADGKDAP